jgi:hypothetical protein
LGFADESGAQPSSGAAALTNLSAPDGGTGLNLRAQAGTVEHSYAAPGRRGRRRLADAACRHAIGLPVPKAA